MAVREFDLDKVDLDALNSATKYPSIRHYHDVGERGLLQAGARVAFPAGPVRIWEKVDGANTRVILTPDRMLIGSREELLWAQYDLLANPAQGIVAAAREFAANLPDLRHGWAGLQWPVQVFFLEAYGGRIGAQAKQYTCRPGTTGLRLFDLAVLDFHPLHDLGKAEAAARRDRGEVQRFMAEDELRRMARMVQVRMVPFVGEVDAAELPVGIGDTLAFLDAHVPARSLAALDESALGRAEGLVLRTADRSVVAKMRTADYRSTVQRTAGGLR